MYMTKHNCDFVHQGFGSAMAGMKNAAPPNQDQFQSCSLSFKVIIHCHIDLEDSLSGERESERYLLALFLNLGRGTAV